MKSPRPPAEVLRRILRTSRLNGWSVALCAGLCSLVSLPFGGLLGLGVGVFVTIGGVMEIRGNRRLRRRDPDGMRLLVRSQILVLGAIWIYAVPQLLSFDPGYLQDQVIPNLREVLAASGSNLDSLLAQAGLNAKDVVPYVHLFFVVLYGTVMLVTLFYQGGLALYYHHHTAAVTEALRAPPAVPMPASAPAGAGAVAVAAPAAPSFSEIDQRYYDRVADELANKHVKPGLWARALAESGADDRRTQAFYIRLRVAELQQEDAARPS
jgi:hypothetical protein